jgi:3-oxoacyl-[acyl-carrier-protein] synthase I
VPDSEPIAITGFGMRTAVGNDAVQTAAAVRAGISRFRSWESLGATFDEAAGVTASILPEGSADEPWVAKASDLVTLPLHEALWSAGVYDFAEIRRALPQSRVGAYVATPYPDRAGVSRDAFRLFAIEAREHCIAPAPADSVVLSSCDHAAGATALARAVDDLRAGTIDYAVVGALDSMLHGDYLKSLWANGRLKLPGQPDGLVPGEAAAIVVLERESGAKLRHARVFGRLGEAAFEHETVPIGPDYPIRAEAAGRAVRTALERNAHAGRPERAIVDLSGERWRSLEWALVETRCLGEFASASWRLWHPADCLGDMGAASGIVHLGLALRSFARGYGGRGPILLVSASERGERAAVCVFPPTEQG